MDTSNNPSQVQVKASDEDLKGRFTNAANVFHADDHFGIDFFYAAPPVGQLLARLLLTPGHAKALRDALDAQLKQFEKQSGQPIVATEDKPTIGFRTSQ